MAVRHRIERPPPRAYRGAEQQFRLANERAAAIAVHRATKKATTFSRATAAARGLGRLGNAIGSTTAYEKGRREGRTSWGAIYARGGDDSRAGQALSAYTRGAVIRPIKGDWLWIQTDALARRIGRRRMTPARYIAAGSPLGKLGFRRTSPNTAQLFTKGVVLTPKGRARVPGRRNKRPTRLVVLFFGIKQTARLKRYDHLAIVSNFAGLVPAEMGDELPRQLRRLGFLR
jgi:hypothetical protein